MPRFLTPSKIGLLALIELYTDAVVPAASSIHILSFILKQVLSSNLQRCYVWKEDEEQLPFLLNISDFESLLCLQPSASGHPGRNLWDHFLTKIWRIDSLNALHEFISRKAQLVVRTSEDAKADRDLGIQPPAEDMIILSRTSPLGLFVRRSIVEYEKLRFTEMMQLWTSLVRWRCETKAYWLRKSGESEHFTGDIVLSQGVEDWTAEEATTLELLAYDDQISRTQRSLVSTDDVEKLLEFQVEKMQSEFPTSDLSVGADLLARAWNQVACRSSGQVQECVARDSYGTKLDSLLQVSITTSESDRKLTAI